MDRTELMRYSKDQSTKGKRLKVAEEGKQMRMEGRSFHLNPSFSWGFQEVPMSGSRFTILSLFIFLPISQKLSSQM